MPDVELNTLGSDIETALFIFPDKTAYEAANPSPSEGDRVELGDHRYEVANPSATNHHLTISGDKLYVRTSEYGRFSFDAWWPAGDGVTDDRAIFLEALDAIPARSELWISPTANHRMSDEINIKKPVTLRGAHTGRPQLNVSIFTFDADKAGFIVNTGDTYSDGLDDGTFGNGNGAHTIFDGLRINGSATVRDETKSGIRLRGRAFIYRCSCNFFGGMGIHNLATAVTGIPFNQGNTNYFLIDTVSCRGNWIAGLKNNGADANAGIIRGVDAVYNGRFGVWESSFLGNYHEGHHTAFNGLAGFAGNASDSSGVVSFGNVRYFATLGATEQQLVDTQPGTDSAVWTVYQSGGPTDEFPLWTPGKPVGTYFFGRCYYGDGSSARNTWVGMYSEGGQVPSTFAERDIIIGGLHGMPITRGAYISADNGQLILDRMNVIGTTGAGISFGAGSHYSFSHADGGLPYRWKSETGHFEMDYGNLGSQTVYWLARDTGDTTAVFPNRMGFNNLMLGTYSNHIGFSTANNSVPANGTTVTKGIYWYRNPSPGNPPGYIVTTGGVVGTDAVIAEMAPLSAAV